MVTMASSNRNQVLLSPKMKEIYCPLRKQWLHALPEEVVRVKLITHMIEQLQFPEAFMVTEKCLQHLPRGENEAQTVPMRRIDLLCYGKGLHPRQELYPLLLVECKAVPLTEKVIRQVIGYNHFLNACFLCVVNEEELQFGQYSAADGRYNFTEELPDYPSLIRIALENGVLDTFSKVP